MTLASFFDPGNNGIDLGDIVLLVGFLIGPTAILVGWLRIWGRRWMRAALRPIVLEVVAEQTKPIQRDANGGKSLPDVNRKVDLIAAHLGIDIPETLQVKD